MLKSKSPERGALLRRARLLLLLSAFQLFSFSAFSQQIINATVTVTNVAGTVNGQTITINGTARTFTNNLTSAQNQIAIGGNVVLASSNLFTAYAIVPASGVLIHWNGTNSVNFQSLPGTTFSAAISTAWGTLAFSTNTITPATVVRVPKSAVGLYEKTNIVNGLVGYLGDNSATSAIPVTAPAFANFLAVAGGTSVQSTNYINKIGTSIFPNSFGTNFWWDFGITNLAGPIVYQTITATNNVSFSGTTNAFPWAILSLNVIASGADRLISMPTNLPHLNTNNLTLSGNAYRLTLTNGNEFRITIQSNATLSTLWTTFGQGQIIAGAGATNISYSSNFFTYNLSATNNIQKFYDFGNFLVNPSTQIFFDASLINGIARLSSNTGGNTEAIDYGYGSGGSPPGPGVIARHTFYLSNIGTNNITLVVGQNTFDPFSIKLTWQFGAQTAPTIIAPGQLYIFDLKRIGGQTNNIVTYTTFTNTAIVPSF